LTDAAGFSPPTCPLKRTGWIEVAKMPEQRLPRHIRVLAALTAFMERHNRQEYEFEKSEALRIILESGACDDIRHLEHELETLAAKKKLGRYLNGMLWLPLNRALNHLRPYTVVTH
jgi:hypothetical protein